MPNNITILLSFFHFRQAMRRQQANGRDHVCPSCGQPLDESVVDCCHPPKTLFGRFSGLGYREYKSPGRKLEITDQDIRLSDAAAPGLKTPNSFHKPD